MEGPKTPPPESVLTDPLPTPLPSGEIYKSEKEPVGDLSSPSPAQPKPGPWDDSGDEIDNQEEEAGETGATGATGNSGETGDNTGLSIKASVGPAEPGAVESGKPGEQVNAVDPVPVPVSPVSGRFDDPNGPNGTETESNQANELRNAKINDRDDNAAHVSAILTESDSEEGERVDAPSQPESTKPHDTLKLISGLTSPEIEQLPSPQRSELLVQAVSLVKELRATLSHAQFQNQILTIESHEASQRFQVEHNISKRQVDRLKADQLVNSESQESAEVYRRRLTRAKLKLRGYEQELKDAGIELEKLKKIVRENRLEQDNYERQLSVFRQREAYFVQQQQQQQQQQLQQYPQPHSQQLPQHLGPQLPPQLPYPYVTTAAAAAAGGGPTATAAGGQYPSSPLYRWDSNGRPQWSPGSIVIPPPNYPSSRSLPQSPAGPAGLPGPGGPPQPPPLQTRGIADGGRVLPRPKGLNIPQQPKRQPQGGALDTLGMLATQVLEHEERTSRQSSAVPSPSRSEHARNSSEPTDPAASSLGTELRHKNSGERSLMSPLIFSDKPELAPVQSASGVPGAPQWQQAPNLQHLAGATGGRRPSAGSTVSYASPTDVDINATDIEDNDYDDDDDDNQQDDDNEDDKPFKRVTPPSRLAPNTPPPLEALATAPARMSPKRSSSEKVESSMNTPGSPSKYIRKDDEGRRLPITSQIGKILNFDQAQPTNTIN